MRFHCANGRRYCSVAHVRGNIVVGMIHTQLIRTEKGAFPEKYHVLMNYSEDHEISLFIENIGYN